MPVSVLGAPAAALGWLGRQGTRAIAALVFVGIAVPPIDALLKPFVSEAIFVLLCISFLCVDPGALRGYVGRPGLVLAATAFLVLAASLGHGVALTLARLIGRSKGAPPVESRDRRMNVAPECKIERRQVELLHCAVPCNTGGHAECSGARFEFCAVRPVADDIECDVTRQL